MANIIETDGARSFPIPGLSVEAGSIEAAELKKETITAEKLATGSVTEAKLGAEAVSLAKVKSEAISSVKTVKPPSVPAPGGVKGEIQWGGSTPANRAVVVLNAKETEKAYKKITHKLKTEWPVVQVYKESTKTTVKVAKVVAENTEEFEIELEATVADKEVFIIVVTG